MGHFRLYSQGRIGHTLAAGSEEATQMLIIGLATRGGVYPRERWTARDFIANYLCKNELRMSSGGVCTIQRAAAATNATSHIANVN